MNLEDDLRRALRRKDAPPDFANRVIASVERGEQPASPNLAEALRRGDGKSRRVVRGMFGRQLQAMQQMPVMRWLAAAAMLTLVAGGGARYYEYQQNVAEAKRIEAEIRLAMQITSEALATVQARLHETARR
jgi:hypothetical protein